MKIFHGTSSLNAKSILENGFSPVSYFTTDFEDAEYYAATGGEASLQKREEQYKKTTGRTARKYFYPDMWDMYEALYPNDEYPVVLVLDSIPPEILATARADSGALGGLVSDKALASSFITEKIRVQWPNSSNLSSSNKATFKP